MPKILAIDDKMDNLVTLSALLANLMRDCAVITAQSGREGIAKAKVELPDAILLDVKMPDMDGFETCRRLKDDARTKHIPVIMITAIKTDSQSRIKGLEIGADAFLAKPIDEYELVSQVKVALRIKKAEDTLREERDSLERVVEERTAFMRKEIAERKRAEADKEKLEAQNWQLQKTESLGRMAGAIAHHFNNQLGVVIGNLEMAIDELPQDTGPVIQLLTAAMQASQKAAVVSSQMLTYLGRSFDRRERLDLAGVCQRNLPILQASMPGNMTLETFLPSPGPTVMANENQIQQVIANLITNAREAVSEGRGAIHLSARTVSTADIPAVNRFPFNWQPQDIAYACLEVTDAGGGIVNKDIEKLFDPFFSSKFTGRGMGLAVVLGIVKAHGGAVTVESKPAMGSIFRVFLPVFAEEDNRQTDQTAQPALIVPALQRGNDATTTSGGGTVLLIDDEEMVREMAAAMLKRLDYFVLEAKDGVEAVEVFRQHQDEIGIVLSDLTMPRMNGWETLTALRKLAPGIPVILASGYDKAQVMAGDHPELPQAFLGKPYKLNELSKAISQALKYGDTIPVISGN